MLTDVAISPGKVKFSRKWFNPLYFILNNIIKDHSIRTVLVYGGKSSSKTVSIAQVTSKQSVIHGDNTIAFRKENVTLKTTLKKSYELAHKTMRIGQGFEKLEFLFRSRVNESEIVLKGLDDEEKAKGLESFRFLNLDELNQFLADEYEQFQMSLRGILGQKVFGSWNPVSEMSWVKRELIDTFEFIETDRFGTLPGPYSFVKISSDGTTVLIKTTYHDNYWIVGSPCGTYGFRDENLINYYEGLKTRNFNAYRINVMGEWGKIRTGGEFWKQFDEARHVAKVDIQKDSTLHISLDENVNPYVTQTFWQVFPYAKKINQVHEILSKSPENNAPKAAAQTARWLRSIGFDNKIFVYGDPSGNKRSTVDEESKSFFIKYIEALTSAGFIVEKRVDKVAPRVAMSGAFINAIYESNYAGWTITISDKCYASIEDYLLVKEDAEGKMAKIKETDDETKVRFEPRGHISDTKRYFMVRILSKEFEQFQGKKPSNLKKQLGYL